MEMFHRLSSMKSSVYKDLCRTEKPLHVVFENEESREPVMSRVGLGSIKKRVVEDQRLNVVTKT